MSTQSAEKLVEAFEQGRLNRRQLASRLMGLGAAMAVGNHGVASLATEDDVGAESTFAATELDHVALNVSDVARSRDFYVQHLGLEVVRQGENHCFLGHRDRQFILALFRREPVGLNHYYYARRGFWRGNLAA